MAGLSPILTLPAPPSNGNLSPLPPSQLPSADDSNLPSEPPKSAPISTHTRTIGIIHPPPDIRTIIDKTANFVSKNGPEFERRILAHNAGNAKFNFLIPSDPYHAYYQHRIQNSASQPEEPAEEPPKPAKTDEIEPPKFKIPVKKVLEPPEAEQYTVRLPDGITGEELDIIKLTAQFVARNGKSFLSGLTSREINNTQFHFLRPTHSLFTFFTTLADAYSKVLMPARGLKDKLRKSVMDRTVVLERCLHRLEWDRSQEQARQKAEDEIEEERVQMAMIDWHDFVVVETIEFADDEDAELPEPLSLEDVVRISKAPVSEEQKQVEEMVEAAKEVEMEMDEEEVQLVEEGMRAARIEDDRLVGRAAPESDGPMRIVRNWKKPEDRLPAEKDPTKFVVSPITGELIPIADMAEHMRISLIDPKYKEQKERMMAKIRETTLAQDDEISRNIVGLARTRPDIFGTTEEEVSNAVKAEMEKKEEQPKQVIWDGHAGSIGRTANQVLAQMPMEDQNMVGAGPAPPPRPAVPAVRPLPPPPGLAMNAPWPMPGTSYSIPAPGGLPARPIPPSVRPIMPPPMPGQQHHLQPMHMHQQMPMNAPGMMIPPPPGSQFAPLIPRPYAPMGPPPPMQMAPPPPLPHGMPPPPPPEEAPPLPDEPEPKRPRIDDLALIPEEKFLAQHPGPARVCISVPNIEEGNLKGQLLEITVQSLSETIGSLKEKIAGEVQLPANKQKLSGRPGFLKDNLTLAHYNIGPGETLTLALRERGGRKR